MKSKNSRLDAIKIIISSKEVGMGRVVAGIGERRIPIDPSYFVS